MKKDIDFGKVEGIAFAIIPENEGTIEEEWNVYLVNLKKEFIEGIIIASSGYGYLDGRKVKTSTLRQFFDRLESNEFIKVEMIEKELFSLNNEFWISFWVNGNIFDKRYVFVNESIKSDYFTQIPLIGKRGVMIK